MRRKGCEEPYHRGMKEQIKNMNNYQDVCGWYADVKENVYYVI